MPKRRPTSSSQPLDIFSEERLTNAMTAATSPVPPAAAEPQRVLPASVPVQETRESTLRSVPSRPERAPEEPPERPVSEPEPAREAAPKEEPAAAKGRANGAEAPEVEEPPEPNVPLKFRVPQTLRSEFHTFKAELSAALGGIALDDSNLARPLVEYFLVEQRERILEEAAAFKGKLKRPANGDAVGMAEFDHAIGEIFREARKRRRASPTSGSTER